MKDVIRHFLGPHVGSDHLEGDMVRLAHRKLRAQGAEIARLELLLADAESRGNKYQKRYGEMQGKKDAEIAALREEVKQAKIEVLREVMAECSANGCMYVSGCLRDRVIENKLKELEATK